jgi:hypothetical protein
MVDATWHSPTPLPAGRCLFVYPAATHNAASDVMAGLGMRGWHVDAAVVPSPLPHSDSARDPFEGMRASANPVARLVGMLGEWLERELAGVSAISAWFDELHATLARNQHDVVVAFVDGSPAGLARLVTRAHARAVLVSTSALTTECRRRATLPLLRLAACLRARQRLHPDLLRPIDLDAMPAVIYGTWSAMDAARVAGVPSGAFRIIGLSRDEEEAPPRRFPMLAMPLRPQTNGAARAMQTDMRREQELTAAVDSIDELLREQCGFRSPADVVQPYRRVHL